MLKYKVEYDDSEYNWELTVVSKRKPKIINHNILIVDSAKLIFSESVGFRSIKKEVKK